MNQAGTQFDPKEASTDIRDDACVLMLYNDNVNTFDFVIENLIELCGHTYEQALQCAWITHCYGKCDVRHGSYATLKGIADIMLQRGLTVKIVL